MSPSVVMLGAGTMGLALAKTLLDSGYRVTVWNRSPGRCDPLVEKGALLAPTISAAVESGDLIIICVADYGASDAVLSMIDDGAALSQKTFVELSSMLPAQMRAQQRKVKQRAGRFVGGGILSAPAAIGAPSAVIVYAGDPDACRQYEKVFKSLAGASRYLGPDPAFAVAAYLTLGVYIIGVQSLFYETGAVARQFGLPLEPYAELVGLIADQPENAIADGVSRVTEQRFGDSEASLSLIASFMRDASLAFGATKVPIPVTKAIIEQLEHITEVRDGALDMSAVYEGLVLVPPSKSV